VIPLFLGGDPYAASNLRAVHRRCNGSRSRRVTPTYYTSRW
jgi:hypothetical protein